MHIRKYIWGICYGFILTVFTGYVILDTFVIKQVYSIVPSEHGQFTDTDIQKENTSMQEDADISMPNDESDVPVVTDRSYKDNNITITVTEHREYNSAIYVADILVSSAEYLKTAFVYLLISLFCALFGAVYEIFSHEVYSFYMLYAFIFPLAGGTFPFLAMSLLRKRYPETVARNIYHSGIATLTVGSIIQGALEIYGTTNRLTGLYWLVGIILLLAGVIFHLGSGRSS